MSILHISTEARLQWQEQSGTALRSSIDTQHIYRFCANWSSTELEQLRPKKHSSTAAQYLRDIGCTHLVQCYASMGYTSKENRHNDHLGRTHGNGTQDSQRRKCRLVVHLWNYKSDRCTSGNHGLCIILGERPNDTMPIKRAAKNGAQDAELHPCMVQNHCSYLCDYKSCR